MKLTKITILLLLSSLFISCEEEEIAWPFNNQSSDLMVVEAVLTNEKKQHIIKLSRPYTEQNLTPETVSGALILIESNDNGSIETINTQESPVGSGIYKTDSIRAVSGRVYTLKILHNNTNYYASDVQPQAEPLVALDYSPIDEKLFKLNFHSSGDNPNYITHYLNWQGLEGCNSLNECEAKIIFYDLKTVDINQQFKPDQEIVEFPAGTIIIRKKYSISDTYREYLRGMLSETAWRGGLFDVYQANAATNLSEGAIGFFAVSTVLSDTTAIK